MDLSKKYNLSGFYLYCGVRGTQKGEISLYPDGKIFGYIIDDNNDGIISPIKKEVIGYLDLEELIFLKSATTVSSFVMWYLRNNKERPLKFDGGYIFLKDPFLEQTIAEMAIRKLCEDGIIPLLRTTFEFDDKLKDMSITQFKKNFEDTLFNKSLYQKIGEFCDNTGSLELNKK